MEKQTEKLEFYRRFGVEFQENPRLRLVADPYFSSLEQAARLTTHQFGRKETTRDAYVTASSYVHLRFGAWRIVYR